jgi:hypothetical protein
MLMMIDSFQPLGFTRLAVDSIFMMPHLGVLASVNKAAAKEVFEKDCLIPLGLCIAPSGSGKYGSPCLSATIKISTPEGDKPLIEDHIPVGEIRLYPMGLHDTAEVQVTPARRFDVGAGHGKILKNSIRGGQVGLVIDTRGRPLVLPEKKEERRELIAKWYKDFGMYD